MADILDSLYRVKRISKKYCLPDSIMPCVKSLLDMSFNEGIRNEVAYIIATELEKEFDEDKTKEILRCWNSENEVALLDREIRSVVKSAYVHPEKKHGCNPSAYILQEICDEFGGKKACQYYRDFIGDKAVRHNDYDYYKYGWHNIVGHYGFRLYFGLTYIEYKRRWKKGSQLYLSVRDMRRLLGLKNSDSLKINAIKLRNLGLINYEIGKQHKYNGKAGMYQRIIPIPKPKNCNTRKQRTATHIEKHQQDRKELSCNG